MGIKHTEATDQGTRMGRLGVCVPQVTLECLSWATGTGHMVNTKSQSLFYAKFRKPHVKG